MLDIPPSGQVPDKAAEVDGGQHSQPGLVMSERAIEVLAKAAQEVNAARTKRRRTIGVAITLMAGCAVLVALKYDPAPLVELVVGPLLK